IVMPPVAAPVAPDLRQAIQYALLVKAAEDVPPDQTVYKLGDSIPIAYDAINVTYSVVTTIYGNDLATDISVSQARPIGIVSFGVVVQDPAGNAVVAIRGTDGIFEWLQDVNFFWVTCPVLPGSGNSEDGFTA